MATPLRWRGGDAWGDFEDELPALLRCTFDSSLCGQRIVMLVLATVGTCEVDMA